MSMEDVYNSPAEQDKRSSYVVTLLLALLGGVLGLHRFYTGYVWIGTVQLVCFLLGLTAPVSILWVLVDLIAISLNKYTDSEGNELKDGNPGCGLIVLIFIAFNFIAAIVCAFLVLGSAS